MQTCFLCTLVRGLMSAIHTCLVMYIAVHVQILCYFQFSSVFLYRARPTTRRVKSDENYKVAQLWRETARRLLRFPVMSMFIRKNHKFHS